MWAFLNNFCHIAWRKHRRGETLLEVLIALFVLGTTSAAATFLILQSSRASLDIQKQFQARYLAREVFEHLKMVRNTNWIRFGEKSCWDISLQDKDCSKQNPKRMVDLNEIANFGLVTAKPGDLGFQLEKVTGDKDGVIFNGCKLFKPANDSFYAVYRHEVKDEYEGVMYSTDTVVPSDQTPMFCRKITLKGLHADAIKIDVEIAWKTSGQLHSSSYSSHLINY